MHLMPYDVFCFIDPDDNGNGVPDDKELDTDGDGIPDYLDDDDDGDGIPDDEGKMAFPTIWTTMTVKLAFHAIKVRCHS